MSRTRLFSLSRFIYDKCVAFDFPGSCIRIVARIRCARHTTRTRPLPTLDPLVLFRSSPLASSLYIHMLHDTHAHTSTMLLRFGRKQNRKQIYPSRFVLRFIFIIIMIIVVFFQSRINIRCMCARLYTIDIHPSITWYEWRRLILATFFFFVCSLFSSCAVIRISYESSCCPAGYFIKCNYVL